MLDFYYKGNLVGRGTERADKVAPMSADTLEIDTAEIADARAIAKGHADDNREFSNGPVILEVRRNNALVGDFMFESGDIDAGDTSIRMKNVVLRRAGTRP